MSQEPVPLDPNAKTATLEDELVAYLDGELDDESGRRIEQLLATDPKVRAALQGLERTWELLDGLDRAHPEESLTRTTLEMVALAAEEDVQQQQAEIPRRRRRRWLLGSGALAAVALAGFLAVALLRPNPNEQLLRDLPVLENLDQYRQVDDIEFLRLLDQEGLFAKETGHGAYSSRGEESLAERRARLETMPQAKKEDLVRLQERFARLDPAEQKRLRELNEQLERDPNAERLKKTMYRYYEWLKTLPLSQRIELSGLPPAERVERIKKLLQEQARKGPKPAPAKDPARVEAAKRLLREQAKKLGKRLDPKDVEGLLAWCEQMADRYGSRFLESLPEPRRREMQQELSGVKNSERRRELFGYLWMQWQSANPGKLPPMNDRDLADLLNRLTKATRDRLQSKPAAEQWRTVAEWIGLFQENKPPVRRPDELIPEESEEDLALFFQHVLSEEEQDRLLSLPGEQMLRELWREYVRSKTSPAPARASDQPGGAKRPAAGNPGRAEPNRKRPWKSPPGSPSSAPPPEKPSAPQPASPSSKEPPGKPGQTP
jgi:hypothetical protein